MKRSGFKRKATKPMKRGTLKKKSKQSISKLQRNIWEHCKRIIRQKYGNTCYTCEQQGLEGSNWQTGHLIPKAAIGAFLKYDLRVLRPQCYRCNINLGGNGAEFYTRMVLRDGLEYVNQIYKDRQKTVKAYDHYQLILSEYEKL